MFFVLFPLTNPIQLGGTMFRKAWPAGQITMSFEFISSVCETVNVSIQRCRASEFMLNSHRLSVFLTTNNSRLSLVLICKFRCFFSSSFTALLISLQRCRTFRDEGTACERIHKTVMGLKRKCFTMTNNINSCQSVS